MRLHCVAVLLVALDPLAHALGGCVPASCGFSVIARLEIGLDNAFARFGWVGGRNLLVGKLPCWRACCFARCRSGSAGGAFCFLGVGRGWGGGVGVNDVLAHLDRPLDKCPLDGV